MTTKAGKKVSRRNKLVTSLPRPGLDENVVALLLGERARFHRFVSARVGDPALADDLLQDSLLRALERSATLRRGESAVAWFYRVLRNAITDHYRKSEAENRRMAKLLADMKARGEDQAVPPRDWDAAVCACFQGLLPSLKPRYAEVIRRVDLAGESKLTVGRDLKIKRATMDVLLHRARSTLRERLEILCGACSRERCLECFCAQREKKEKV